MGTSKLSVTIIGTGALGSTLQRFFEGHDYLIQSTWNSKGGLIYSDDSEEFKKVTSALPEADEEIGDLIFITTPDDLIQNTAQFLSEKSISWERKIVVHCSGNLTTEELKALAEKGAKIVSMHPVQPFKKGDESERFNEIYISLQGDKKAKEKLVPIIQEMGARSIFLDKKQKRNLHIAAVMASNYLVALMFSVENLLKDSHIDEGFDALEPLVNQTVSNIFEKGPAGALTGPISRGDNDSVRTHLKELKGRDQGELYKILGLEAVKIAEKTGDLSKDQIDELKYLLRDSHR